MLRDLVRASRGAVCQVVVNAGRSKGSGFFLQASGHVVTCAHVIGEVEKVQAIELIFQTGRFRASVAPVQELAAIDIALLQITNNNLSAISGLSLGSFDGVEAGDSVLVLGFPLGEPVLTATAGIVSAKGRFLFPNLTGQVEAVKLDASVNPGNSGGPCLDPRTGRVVGVVSSRAPVSAAIAAEVGKQIAAAKQWVQSPQRATITFGGVDPVALNIRLADLLFGALEATRQLGIGYAISVDSIKSHIRATTAE